MAYKIAVLGTGYVGLVCGVGLADFGNYVTCTDIDSARIALLERGVIPIYEPGLEEYFERNRKEGRLYFDANISRTIQDNDVLFVAVGTPSKENGEVDLSYLEYAVETIARESQSPKVVVIKSTVPVGTTRRVAETLRERNRSTSFSVVANPEFLREGKAVYDFFHPDKVVIGVEDERAKEILREIYRPLYLLNTPLYLLYL